MAAFESEHEYREALGWLAREEERLFEERDALHAMGLPTDEVRVFQAISQARFDRISKDVQEYQDSLLGEFEEIENMEGLGRFLVALRLAKGITVGELAERLGVEEGRVRHAESLGYGGVTVERVEEILKALDVDLITRIELL